jgi:hypothetical protein
MWANSGAEQEYTLAGSVLHICAGGHSLGWRVRALPHASAPHHISRWVADGEDDPRMSGQWRKTPRWSAGGIDPPRPLGNEKRGTLCQPSPPRSLGLIHLLCLAQSLLYWGAAQGGIIYIHMSTVQGRFREYSGNIQGTFREHSLGGRLRALSHAPAPHHI